MRTVHPHRVIVAAICAWSALSITHVAADAGPNFDLSLLTDCWEWVVGYSTESCTQTCAQVNRTCDHEKTGEILSASALSDAISTSFLLGSSIGPGTMATFCNGGVNVWPFATAPAAFAYQIFKPSAENPEVGEYIVYHYCYFPPNPSAYQGNCTTQYIDVPSQRICSCYNGACPPTFAPTNAPVPDPTVVPSAIPTFIPTSAPSEIPTIAPSTAPSVAVTVATDSPSHALTNCYEWVVGYSRDSCTETCAEVGRTCAEGQLAAINSVQALEDALATSSLLSSTTGPGNVATFCDGGVNVYPFATAPAAFAYQTFIPDPNNPATGIYKISHYCYFPTNPSDLVDGCDVTFVMPPSQRICSCYNGACPPTAAPTVVPSPPAPQGECLEWILGYSTESCSLTCSRVSRECRQSELETIITQQAFYNMVASATDLESSSATGPAPAFCNQGINAYTFAPVPAAYTYLLCLPSGDVQQTYCNYPTSLQDLGGDCDVAYVYPPAQRFCPCTLSDCPIEPVCHEWVLGYSTESCTLTCNRVSGVCNAANLASIVTQQAFYDMVAVATVIDASCPTGNNADVFCTQGVNTYQFAQAPAAFSYLTHNANGEGTETYCNYPTSLAGLNADCDAAYVYPPSRRFCSCTMSTCSPPSAVPSAAPNGVPTLAPSVVTTHAPSVVPTMEPSTASPSAVPTVDPSVDPSVAPSVDPSVLPTVDPTMDPTDGPTVDPSVIPTLVPSVGPTVDPSVAPSADPTVSPSASPTFAPSVAPTAAPSFTPSRAPSRDPTRSPSRNPTRTPSRAPSRNPTARPSRNPTRVPTASPTGCFKFVIGYSEKSCTETCADPEVGVGGVCENSIINTIDTEQDFSSMLTSALLLGSGGSSPSSVAAFCKGGLNVFAFANSPAAFAYQEYLADPTPHFVANNYCYYRPAAQGPSTDTCETKYLYPPSQRMCSCRVASCVDSGAFPVPNYGRRLEGEEEEEDYDYYEEYLYLDTAMAVDEAQVAEAKDERVLTTTDTLSVKGLLLLALFCALTLYNTLTITKTASDVSSGESSPSSAPASAPSSPLKTLRTTRNSHKREVYIDISET